MKLTPKSEAMFAYQDEKGDLTQKEARAFLAGWEACERAGNGGSKEAGK